MKTTKNKTKTTKKINDNKKNKEKLLSKEEKTIIDKFKIVNNLYYSALDKFNKSLDKPTTENKIALGTMIMLLVSMTVIGLYGIINGKHILPEPFIFFILFILIPIIISIYYLFNNNYAYVLKLRKQLKKIKTKAYEIILEKIHKKSKKIVDIESIEIKKINDDSKLKKLNELEDIVIDLLEDKKNKYFYTIKDSKIFVITNENLSELLKTEFGFKNTEKTIKELNNKFENYILLKKINSLINKKRIAIVNDMLSGIDKDKEDISNLKFNLSLDTIKEKKNKMLKKINDKDKEIEKIRKERSEKNYL